MAVRIGINGFGRIGRNFLRAVPKSGAEVEVVGVNDLVPVEVNAGLLKYDSTHGRIGAEVTWTDTAISVGGPSFRVCAERDPKALPSGDLGVDVVIDATGLIT